METGREPPVPAPELRRLRLRYVGVGVVCGLPLARGAEALYQPSTGSVRCLECPPAGIDNPGTVVDVGTAGGSARREYERRKASREARVKGRLGDWLGGVVVGVTGEPQSTRAWARGARGEEELAAALAEGPGVTTLHDRRVPGIGGNIDHIVIAPAGVFVVDAKRYEGLIRIRDKGGLLRTDLRLYVGRRDCSKLASDMGWQVATVERALAAAALAVIPPIIPVLCFVDGEWPLLRPPESFRGVRLEGTRSIRKLITSTQLLDSAAIERLARILATAFPPK